MANAIFITDFKTKYNNFLELTRAYSLPISMFTWFASVCWAAIAGAGILNLVLSFFAIILLHLGANLLDDYVDLKRELKKGTSLQDVHFSGAPQKVMLIRNGTYPLKDIPAIIGVLFCLAIIIGIYFTIARGPLVIGIAAVAAVLCLLYPHASRWGLGELIIAVLFGPLLTLAVYFILTGSVSPSLQWFSLTLALFNVIVLHVHSLMDWEHDIERCKRTLCTIFKTKENAVITLITLIALGYLNIIMLVVLKYLSPWFLLVFATLPAAVELVISMKNFIAMKDLPLKPRWFYGPMEDWEKLCDKNHHYFMFRFYLARNLAMFTALIGGLTYYLTGG